MIQDMKCPSCGSPLDYSYGVEEIKCNYCGITVIIDSYRHAHQPDYEDDVIRVLRSGKYIEAVKMVRYRSGLGLKEAKQYVDSLAARSRIPVARQGSSRILIISLVAFLMVLGLSCAVFFLTAQ